jgi:hypothetical protein
MLGHQLFSYSLLVLKIRIIRKRVVDFSIRMLWVMRWMTRKVNWNMMRW